VAPVSEKPLNSNCRAPQVHLPWSLYRAEKNPDPLLVSRIFDLFFVELDLHMLQSVCVIFRSRRVGSYPAAAFFMRRQC